MAGRRSSPRARAIASLTTALALVAGAAAPSGAAPVTEAPKPPIVVAQTDANGGIPFGRRHDTGRIQKVAQTFVAPKEAAALTKVSLLLEGDDRNAVLEIFEVGEAPPLGTLLGTVTIPVDYHWGDPGSGWIHTRIRPALPVEPGTRYSFVLTSERRRDSFAAASGSDRYADGEAWCFCPDWVDGAVDYTNQRWQDMAEAGMPADVSFELRFRPAA